MFSYRMELGIYEILKKMPDRLFNTLVVYIRTHCTLKGYL